MSSKDQNLSEFDLKNCPSGKGLKIHIAVSDWNQDITSKLLEGAKSTLLELGLVEDDIETVHTPGAFELPFAAKILIKSKSSDAVICLGCVIKGETSHDEYINNAVALGITQLSLASDIPVIFGLLTVNDQEQALDRCGGKHGNKGIEAAVTAVKMVDLKKQLSKQKSKIGF